MRVKICGLTTPEAVAAAVGAGARYVGFVFFPASPRSLDAARARALALEVMPGVAKVGLVVDIEDDALDALLDDVPLDMLQLHGRETPERVAELRSRHGLPVMKAVGLRDEADLGEIARYEAVADQLLIDAKPPADARLPGGNAVPFDWRLIAGRAWKRPWMLAGGLSPDNVAEAVRRTGAIQLDVSSGVESAPGVKDPAKIRAFIAAATAAGAAT